MKQYFEIIGRSRLFYGITPQQRERLWGCLAPAEAEYDKNEYLFHQSETTSRLAIVASGAVSIIKEDYWGNRNIISRAEPGDIFAEVYACLPGTPLAVSAVADEKTAVIYIEIEKITASCAEQCEFHSRLILNLLSEISRKSLMLNEKLTHITRRTTREKLLSYLSAMASGSGSSEFQIPFNREQLADYLSVDRSALSAELSRMRREGLLEYRKNAFKLL